MELSKIVNFIKGKLKEFGKRGIVIGLSGGLDSSVVGSLCVRAAGKNKVIGLVMPEKEENEESLKDAKKISEILEIKLEVIDISRILDEIGAYKSVISFFPGKKLKSVVVKKGLGLIGKNSFDFWLKGSNSKLISNAKASSLLKHRLRMILIHYYAEKNNLLVAGSANKTEIMTGLFSKFGIDNCADIMPIANLYRTEVIEIAKRLKIPQFILDKKPNPGIMIGVDDKYEDIIGLSYDDVDIILKNINKKPEWISKKFNIDLKKVKFVINMNKKSEHMRNPNMTPK